MADYQHTFWELYYLRECHCHFSTFCSHWCWRTSYYMFEYPGNIKACYEPATYSMKSHRNLLFKYYFYRSISYLTRYARNLALVLFPFLLLRLPTMALSINNKISTCDVSMERLQLSASRKALLTRVASLFCLLIRLISLICYPTTPSITQNNLFWH